MNSKIVALIASSALVGPVAALAASETIDYTSADLTTTWTSGSFAGEVSGTNSYFTVALTLDAPLAKGATTDVSTIPGDVMGLTLSVFDPGAPTKDQTYSVSPGILAAEGSSFVLTTNSSGAITGWDFTAGNTNTSDPAATPTVLFHSCSNESCKSGSIDGNAYGVTGDWYDQPGTSQWTGGCTYNNPANGCGTGGSSTSVGKWSVSAPELNSATAVTGVLLLIGGILVLRAERPRGIRAA